MAKSNIKYSRSGLYILIVAAVVLEATSLLQYYYSENVIKVASKALVESKLQNLELQVMQLPSSDDNVQLDYIKNRMQEYPNCFYAITDSTGINLVPAPDTVPDKKYHTFRQNFKDKGWTMSVLIADEDIYGNLKRLGGLITFLMLFGMALLIFILYRATKNALNLYEATRKNDRIESELNIAKKIQMSMLPKTFPPYPNREDLNMYGIIVPAKEVGGDLFDFYVREEKLFFCIGDVSGKGVPASLVMAVSRSLFRTISAHKTNPAEIVSDMNDAMSDMNEQNMFVTLFLGVLDLKNGTLNYCNAGHNAPVLAHHHHTVDSNIMLPVKANIPLGVMGNFAYEMQTISMLYGDTLFLYTDGLTEAENAAHEQYSESRMMNIISAWSNNLSAKEQIADMQHSVEYFVGSAEQSDDLTMLSMQYLGNPNHHHLILRNDIQQIPTLAEWVDSINIPQDLNMSINLALEEAVANVMLYAYPKDTPGKVDIDAIVDDDKITFIISDSGKPFDPTKHDSPDITASVEDRKIGGLGIYLVEQIMDSIHYEYKNNQNILTLIKTIKS